MKEKIRLKVGLMFRGHQFGGHGFSQTVMDFMEFISTIDIMDHFSDQFEDGMTTENHDNGAGQWSVGHRIPQAYYSPSDP